MTRAAVTRQAVRRRLAVLREGQGLQDTRLQEWRLQDSDVN